MSLLYLKLLICLKFISVQEVQAVSFFYTTVKPNLESSHLHLQGISAFSATWTAGLRLVDWRSRGLCSSSVKYNPFEVRNRDQPKRKAVERKLFTCMHIGCTGIIVSSLPLFKSHIIICTKTCIYRSRKKTEGNR